MKVKTSTQSGVGYELYQQNTKDEETSRLDHNTDNSLNGA